MTTIRVSLLLAAALGMLAFLSEAPAARDFVDGWEGG